jgi:predicted ATPase with chaperone activity
MKTLSIALAAAGLVATTSIAGAHHETYGRKIDSVQATQQRQIEHGRYSGELTRREYRQLLEEQAKIAELERKAKADGYISTREYREIKKVQSEANAHIRDESSDGNVSFWRRWLYRTR